MVDLSAGNGLLILQVFYAGFLLNASYRIGNLPSSSAACMVNEEDMKTKYFIYKSSSVIMQLDRNSTAHYACSRGVGIRTKELNGGHVR